METAIIILSILVAVLISLCVRFGNQVFEVAKQANEAREDLINKCIADREKLADKFNDDRKLLTDKLLKRNGVSPVYEEKKAVENGNGTPKPNLSRR